MDPKEIIAKRVAKEIKDNEVVNLGIGLPTMVAKYISKNANIILHSENGMLGLGPPVEEGKEDKDIFDAGGNFVTVIKGGSFFDSSFSFSIIRGRHIDKSVLGALEVDQEGNLANWMIPGKLMTGMGGAMDLVYGAKKVIIAMLHTNKNGAYKILNKCHLPLTAMKEVDLIVTELAFIEVTSSGLLLKEIIGGLTIEELQNLTEPKLMISPDLKKME